MSLHNRFQNVQPGFANVGPVPPASFNQPQQSMQPPQRFRGGGSVGPVPPQFFTSGNMQQQMQPQQFPIGNSAPTQTTGMGLRANTGPLPPANFMQPPAQPMQPPAQSMQPPVQTSFQEFSRFPTGNGAPTMTTGMGLGANTGPLPPGFQMQPPTQSSLTKPGVIPGPNTDPNISLPQTPGQTPQPAFIANKPGPQSGFGLSAAERSFRAGATQGTGAIQAGLQGGLQTLLSGFNQGQNLLNQGINTLGGNFNSGFNQARSGRARQFSSEAGEANAVQVDPNTGQPFSQKIGTFVYNKDPLKFSSHHFKSFTPTS